MTESQSKAGKGPHTIEARIVRYADLIPCRDAFIDTRSPGSDRKENFTIIGPGVAESPTQHVHITEPHGFNIGGARQPPGCLNSQHSHETVEVFYVHSGRWRFITGVSGQDGSVELGPGDLISIPTGVFRGFENIGTVTGFLFAVLGGDDPGHVLWAPYVFEMAKDYGLILLESGKLIDTANGETIPAGERPMAPTSPEQVARLRVIDSKTLEGVVIRSGADRPGTPFSVGKELTERVLIGTPPISWPHDFTIVETTLSSGDSVPAHSLGVPDVWFVQSGRIELSIGGERAQCGPGDTITVPRGAVREIINIGDDAAVVVQVRRGDTLPEIHRVT